MKVRVKKLYPDAKLPEYATDGSGCFDLCAYWPEKNVGDGFQTVYATKMLHTGLSFEIPEGHVMLVFSRSGHGFNYGVRLVNCVGVIDSDYRGELKVKLIHDEGSVNNNRLSVRHGDRIAQGLIIPIPKVSFEEVDKLSETARGEGGFGSTGK